MIDTTGLPIRTEKSAYVFDYPQAEDLAKKQRSIFWTAEEIPVANDKQDFLVTMTEAEQAAVKTTLKLFTIYELILGGEVWGDRIFHAFPRPEIQMMSNAFSFAELNMHAPFYAKLNQVLMIDTEEFYGSYKNDPVLAERIQFVWDAIADDDLLYALSVFTLMENCVLYSNFAFLKHFQSGGKNLLQNVVSGINFSARDENLHATGGAWLFRTTLAEYERTVSPATFQAERDALFDRVGAVADYVYGHEQRIVEMLFAHGPIPGIEQADLETFVKSRVNLTLDSMGMEPLFEVVDNPVAEWFYSGINGTQFHDFFQVTGNEYNRTIGEMEFVF
ncbi:ribonucleotide-diphosphate reductase subunit beta [Nocardioides sp. zg-DK7169]|uniref:ribonucleotide-diphosphate reductase subunit beta n=1 Tax=Nocardioides sp. zg-DK7169 TaxID=2736600 RepID=UPI001552794E|nr:ribonucleotide-diphosphate reductase subunit beta [Nocardioides sp. zg-DK7169]NPC95221.1 ribonucleotide-diphosphate reductase subunit beta [Nocardioides sp. zg-DK7169]